MPAPTKESRAAGVPDDRRERRRTQILKAALRLIGREGREAITHRAVAKEAGVPLGSTTYYFESRDDLLAQALQQMAAEQIAKYESLGPELSALDSPAKLAKRLLADLLTAAKDRTAFIAEYELWLEAGRRPELREAAQGWCAAERGALADALDQLGSSEPAADASLVAAVLDGFGERILAADDADEAAKEHQPELRRLIERLVG